MARKLVGRELIRGREVAASVVTRSRMFLVAAMAALMVLVLSLPAQAQDASALTDPLKSGATSALTAGFGVAAVLLVGFLIYRAVKRFTSA